METESQSKQISKCLTVLLDLENKLYRESRLNMRFGLILHQKQIYWSTIGSMTFSAAGMLLALATGDITFGFSVLSLIFLFFFLHNQYKFYRQKSLLRLMYSSVFLPPSMVKLIQKTIVDHERVLRVAFNIKISSEQASPRKIAKYKSIFTDLDWSDKERVKEYCYLLGGLLIFLKRNGVISKRERPKKRRSDDDE